MLKVCVVVYGGRIRRGFKRCRCLQLINCFMGYNYLDTVGWSLHQNVFSNRRIRLQLRIFILLFCCQVKIKNENLNDLLKR